MEYFLEAHHRDVILVTDRVLSAALTVKGHRAILVHGVEHTHAFYGLYAVSKRLRKDLKSYYAKELAIDALEFNELFDELTHLTGK